MLVDDETIAAFYAERVPADVHSRAGVRALARATPRRRDPRVLHLTREALMRHAAAHVTEELFPARDRDGGHARCRSSTASRPAIRSTASRSRCRCALLNQLDDARLTWLVPGMVREKVTLLPQVAAEGAGAIALMPLPDVVTAFLEAMPFGEAAAARCVARVRSTQQLAEAPPVDAAARRSSCRRISRSTSASSTPRARSSRSGRDLAELRAQLGEAAQLSFAAAGPAFERKGLQQLGLRRPAGDAGGHARQGQRLTGYPALVDEGDAVSLRAARHADAAEAVDARAASCA